VLNERRGKLASQVSIQINYNLITMNFYFAKCEGLPNGPCPKNRHDGSVKLGEGDLMLCPDCNRTRFEHFMNTKVNMVDDSSMRNKSTGADGSCSEVNKCPTPAHADSSSAVNCITATAQTVECHSVDGRRASVRIAAARNGNKKSDNLSIKVTTDATNAAADRSTGDRVPHICYSSTDSLDLMNSTQSAMAEAVADSPQLINRLHRL